MPPTLPPSQPARLSLSPPCARSVAGPSVERVVRAAGERGLRAARPASACGHEQPGRFAAAAEVEATPGDLSYLRAGNPAGPRVVLVHGTPGSATAWADYLLDPPPGLELVALDRPGFDRSGPEAAAVSASRPRRRPSWAACCRPMAAPVVLLGHSLGGTIVARVAAEHPARVTALVLYRAASLDPAQEKIHPMQWVGAWALGARHVAAGAAQCECRTDGASSPSSRPWPRCCRASLPRCLSCMAPRTTWCRWPTWPSCKPI